MNKPINAIVLEGAPFSGKTTVLNYLRERCANQFIVIPETGEYVGGDSNFPNLPFKSDSEVLFSIFFFSEIERQRVADAARSFDLSGRPVIFDRITPLSSLIFFYLLSKRYFGDMIYTADAVKLASQHFRRYCDDNTFLLPNKVVYLEPLNDDIFRQRMERKTHNKIFEDIESYHLVCRKYEEVFETVYAGGFVKKVMTENSDENLEVILKAINTLIPIEAGTIDASCFFVDSLWLKKGEVQDAEDNEIAVRNVRKSAIDKAKSLMRAAGYI